MELLQVLFVFGLLWKAGDTTESENVSFSVERTCQNYRVIQESCTCLCEDDSWKEDIQEYYDGCYSATREFRGESYELADNVVKSLEEYFTKMIYFTNSNSAIVTKSVTAIAKALAACKTLKSSSWNIIYQFDKVYPPISDEFNAIAENLRDHIGDLTDTFTNAVSDLKVVFSKYMKDFLGSPLGCGRNVDFKKVLKKLQKLMNTVALINETLLKKCDGEASQEVRESVMILDLLYFYKAIVVQGIYSCVLDVMYDRKCYIPLTFKSCSHSLNYAILTIGEAVNAVVFPLTKTLTALLRIFIDITMVLNETLKSVIELVEGVETTVGSIVKNLLKGTEIKKSISDDRTNILKGLLRK